MAKFESRLWASDPMLDAGIGIPRRDRKGGLYRVYLPDPVFGRSFSIGGAEAADISDAEHLIAELDRSSTYLADTEALARLLLRAESVASSRMEGLEVGAGRLLRADAARIDSNSSNDDTAAEVLANIDAMTFAIREVTSGSAITPELLLETHRLLLKPTRIAEHGGHFRTRQNWIGLSDYTPVSASFVPPPPEMVQEYINDLCAFCNDDSLPAVAQAAIGHAQFETIHPFVDGNGRIGRVLIHLIFRKRRLTKAVSPPVSLILATRARDYVAGLTATRYDGEPDSPSAVAGINSWLGTFASACSRAAAESATFEREISAIQQKWRERLGRVRSNSVILRIIEMLPGTPIITAASVHESTGVALSSVMTAIERLCDANIVRPLKVGKVRKQVFEAGDIVTAFTHLERQLGSPAGDTKIEEPVRRVPARPYKK